MNSRSMFGLAAIALAATTVLPAHTGTADTGWGNTTLAAMRTSILGGGTGYTASDPLTAGAASLTSVTSTGVVTGSGLAVSAAVGKIVPGATSLSIRNAADGADNLLIADSGAITVRSTISGVTTLTATSVSATTLSATTVTVSGTLLSPYTSGVTKTVWMSQDATALSTKGPFQLIVGGSTFGSTHDDTMYVGYNLADGGGNTVSTEPSFGYVTEQDYQVASTHFVEAYFEWHNIGGSLGKRPIFWQWNRATGAMTSMNVRSNGISFTEWDDATEPVYATLGRTGFILNGYATQSADTTLVVNAQNGKFGNLSLGGGFLIQANGSSARWTLGVGSGTPIEMTSTNIIFGGNGNFGGTATIETPSSRKDNDHTLVLRPAASQSTQLLRAFASNGSTVLYDILLAGGTRSYSPTSGVGYGAGAGGAISQGTDKTTAVALNKVTGAITTTAASLADATNVTFTVTNTAVLANDVIAVVHTSGGTLGAYLVTAHSPVAGTSFKITIRNVSGGPLSEALVLNYNILRGANS